MALLEEVCHSVVDFEVARAQARLTGSLFFLLCIDPVVEPSAPSLAPCLPPYHNENALYLGNRKQASIKRLPL